MPINNNNNATGLTWVLITFQSAIFACPLLQMSVVKKICLNKALDFPT